MTVEGLKTTFDWMAVILLFFTFAAGVGVLITGNVINERQAEKLRKFAKDLKDKDLEIEQEKMARLKLAEEITWRTPDRALIGQLAPPLQQFTGQRYTIVSDPGEPERSSVVSWIVILLGTANWKLEAALPSPRSELTFQATNIVLWVSPTAPNTVLEVARALVPVMERGGLPTVVLQSGWGPQPDVAPPELIRVVIFKRGPRMTVTGNMITFEGSPTQIFFGAGPPH
jgi:hypothetical protein